MTQDFLGLGWYQKSDHENINWMGGQRNTMRAYLQVGCMHYDGLKVLGWRQNRIAALILFLSFLAAAFAVALVVVALAFRAAIA